MGRVLDDKTLGFADFRGNRQYVSLGNLLGNDRMALFFIDGRAGFRLRRGVILDEGMR
jgi:uncharacterized protein